MKTATEFDVVIIGGGSGGVATAASLKSRNAGLSIAIVEPSEDHYYQPGWTMVGGGIFDAPRTHRKTAEVIPADVQWIKSSATEFDPDNNRVKLDDGATIGYQRLVVTAGIKLDWDAVDGLSDTLGKNGVTSNYSYKTAPYTWQLVQGLNEGRAIFTQPPMPIKCAGAPQKAMYLSSDAWLRRGVLKNITVDFNNAGGVLFGVKEYVPALMEYVKKYNANLNFFHNLVAVDGSAKKAWFDVSQPETETKRIEVEFDMLHVCPPQTAPDFIRHSPLADAAGWVDVDKHTLRHTKYDNIWGLGDVTNTSNAKTMAAVRIQAPIVAENMSEDIRGGKAMAHYDGYGSCPLTVERGKIVLAEFVYGGVPKPSFPKFVNNDREATRKAWLLKERVLPPVYWQAMLKGHEWMAKPQKPAK